MQRVACAEGFTRLNIQMTAQFTCQLIAQPEGEGVRFAVVIALGIVQEREVQIINFTYGDAFTRVQNTERQAILRRFVGADFESNLPDLGGGDRILDQHQQDPTQRFAIAMALVIRREVVVDQQLQPFALNDREHLRNHFIDQILDRKERWGTFPDVIFQHVCKLDFVDHTHKRLGLARQLLAFWRIQTRSLSSQRF